MAANAAEHEHGKTTASQGVVESLLHSAHVVEREVRIDFANLLLYRAGQGDRIAARTHHDIHGARHVLGLRKVIGYARV